MNRTKIIATIGPASWKRQVIKKMIEAGCSVFRLNFSHGNHEIHAANIRNIRDIATKLNRPIAIIADLQGPKIRTGRLDGEVVQLRRGHKIELTTKNIIGNENRIMVDWPHLPMVAKVGMTILLSEGRIKLCVLSRSRAGLRCRIVQGGTLGERKGVNILGIKLRSVLTGKDKRDIKFAVQHGVDAFALSFIQNASDVVTVKKYIKRFKEGLPIIAKIEKPEAVYNLGKILREVDGVMVARGDLGIEGRLEKIPIWQKKIIREANADTKIVITATQMLESMITEATPTRAEVTDVANAIFDGTDAVMLSGETAVGKYPVQAVRMMKRIIRSAEKNNIIKYYLDLFNSKEVSLPFSIAHASIDAAREAQVKAIIVFTLSGFTARFISERRPQTPIFALTPNKSVYNSMSMLWGVYPILIELGKNIDVVIRNGINQIKRRKLLKNGNRAVIVYGLAEKRGGADRMRIITIGEDGV